MNKNDQNFIAQRIRAQYVKKESSALDELCEMDAWIKRPARFFATVIGAAGALITGSGMSLIMTDIGKMMNWQNAFVSGIIIGTLGLLMMLGSYPCFKRILEKRKKKFGDKILALSDEIINKQFI